MPSPVSKKRIHRNPYGEEIWEYVYLDSATVRAFRKFQIPVETLHNYDQRDGQNAIVPLWVADIVNNPTLSEQYAGMDITEIVLRMRPDV